MVKSDRAWIVWMSWTMSLCFAVAVGWWAAGRATRPPQVAAIETQVVTAEVIDGIVTVQQAYGITVRWPTVPVGVNGLEGTLTSVSLKSTGSEVKAGDVLYTIDLSPVLAVEGDVPAFRALEAGSRGVDVKQLETFLVRRGYLSGIADAFYDDATAAAVNRWLKAYGLAQDGRVPLGRIVFLPTLPSTLAIAPNLRIGARVTPGQELLVGATSEPSFSFRVLPEAVARTTPGMEVTIEADGLVWRAEVERLSASADDADATIATLRAVTGTASICGENCAGAVELGGASVLPGTLVLVPTTSGLQVPSAAIRTNAAGASCVLLVDGSPRRVTVDASSDDGRSIITGVTLGDRVVVAGKNITC